MIGLAGIALGSLRNRAITAALTVCTVALSVALLVGVERLRLEARDAFLRSVSGTDLIIGARSHPVQLLLYSVFRLGDPTNNLGWESVERLRDDPRVAWVLPIALGDSHRGFRVVGTDASYFTHVRYAGDQSLAFSSGRAYAGGAGDGLFEAVVGMDVARKLGYSLGDQIVLAHGTARVSVQKHDDRPFTVVGILARSGTPSDQGVFVSLEAIEAIHLNWRGGTRVNRSPRAISPSQLQPASVSAAFVGLRSRMASFAVQRELNEDPREPMTAILPGVALQQLWSLLGNVERVLQFAAAAVMMAALMVLLTATLASLGERRREMAILRSVGAGPRHVFALLLMETAGLALVGAAAGVAVLELGLVLAAPWLQAQYGLLVQPSWPSTGELARVGAVLVSGVVLGLLPAAVAWRRSLQDGMTVRT